MLSESFCLVPSDGAEIVIPTKTQTGEQKDITIKFQFTERQGEPTKAEGINAVGNGIEIKLLNFAQTLPSGTNTPMGFSIGDTKLELMFSATALINPQDSSKKTLNLCVSLYEVKT